MGISGASVIRIELNDRGDPAAFDVTQAAMTLNNAWQNLDLSAFVPADAAWILLRVEINDTNPGRTLHFRKDGNANAIAIPGIVVQVSGVSNEVEILVPCSAARIIEYRGSAALATVNVWRDFGLVCTDDNEALKITTVHASQLSGVVHVVIEDVV